MLGLFSLLAALAVIAWFLDGGPGRVLRGEVSHGAMHLSAGAFTRALAQALHAIWRAAPASQPAVQLLLALVGICAVAH
jgi:hypothetical protein